MKKYILLLAVIAASINAFADGWSISGKVIGKDTFEPISMVAVRLMKADSSFVTGMATSDQGIFILKPEKGGNYILKLSSMGYKTVYRNVTLDSKQKTVALGSIPFETNDVLLEGATITGKAAKVVLKEDTFVYNAAAYKVPEGAYLESLIEALPGIVIEDDGSISINGKTVSQIRVDGKDFFKGDNSVAMKNLPAEMVDKIKAYEKKSDYTEQTGIEDGNEETVLDLQLKAKLKRAWFSNVDLAAGNKDRYAGQLFANGMTENSRISLIGNMNNTNNRGFRGGRGGGGGLTATKRFGTDMFWNNGINQWKAKFFEIGGNLSFTHTNSDNSNQSNSETFLTSGKSTFSNSTSKNFNRSNGFQASLNVRWNPDSLTTMQFRPNFNYNKSNGNSRSLSATFNSNPYDLTRSPLDSVFLSYTDPMLVNPALRDITVNRNNRQSLSENNNFSTGAEFNITRRLNKNGRSVSLRLAGNYSDSESKSFNLSDIYYYQTSKHTINNQYSVSPSKNWNYSARISYSEPLYMSADKDKNLTLQTSYNFEHRFQDQDRTLYQLDSLNGYGHLGIAPLYPIGHLPEGDSLLLAKNFENSRYATYIDDVHTINIGLRYFIKDKINFSFGARMQPQHTKLDYQKDKLDTVVTRSVFNISPDVRLRFNISKVSRVELRYRGNSNQPSMTNLLDITDSSDPLNISKGNPGLKPSWNNSLDAEYNNYIRSTQTSYSVRVNYSNTRNSISNAVIYDEQTGVRTSQPENINGNWNAGFNGTFNTSFSDESPFNFSSNTSYNFSNNVGFVSLNRQTSQKNTVRNTGIGERLRASYRKGLFEFGIYGNINYQHSRSELQKQANLDTYNFSYGGNLQYTTEFGLGITSDIGMNSRRGYSDASMNTNELLWNAQLSYSFLQGKKAVVMLQFYDILHRQSNISRTINAQMRRDSRTNAITSYFMLHFIYKFNFFMGEHGKIIFGRPGGKKDDDGRDNWGRGMGGPGMGGPGMGGGRGGWGGGGGGPR